ncbi:hypothetical protein [Cohnella cellulosilytica]|uniref:hypothetical protein n=1 Tax=Cohnella cellulosilytica TaxID=986710 RepID=UPI00366BD7C7
MISAIVSFGFSLDAYSKAKRQGESALTNAMYAMSRSFSLVLACLIPIFFETYSYLLAVAAAMIGVQFFDGFVGLRVKNAFKTIGPFATAAGNGLLLLLLLLN